MQPVPVEELEEQCCGGHWRRDDSILVLDPKLQGRAFALRGFGLKLIQSVAHPSLLEWEQLLCDATYLKYITFLFKQ